ncbi:MAG TPA: type II toxin-antitoxin system RelE/ParE family toxin [Oscillatoriaceae cyanobacterium M33_DOE_052]|uniref:Addiction module toxin RelE n=1 Tax=Planktothricoides sp. SpSt-374 TaxID=2282167 RepID=A0A7C3ZZ27_9CYAN|nr:type II toxin-antitoxin system RelE/ParE family toxin [Oscillatoriaceae cyanobacterium M33_DOE_052]
MLQQWTVILHKDFEPEFDALNDIVQDELLNRKALLQQAGPQLGRPYADTLKGSKHPNMKELRFNADNGVWRVAFAFDPDRQAIILVAGDKAGQNESRFYKQLIAKADARFDQHLKQVEE